MTIIEKEMKREGGLNSVLREEREGGSWGGGGCKRRKLEKPTPYTREGGEIIFYGKLAF